MSQPKKQKPFFTESDLKKLEFYIVVFNTTSQMKVKPKAGQESKSVSLVEIGEDTLRMALPPRCCAAGHSMAVDIRVKRTSGEQIEETSVHILGVVDDIDGRDDGQVVVTLKLRQFSQAEWDQLIGFLSAQQLSLNTLIKGTRK